MDEPIYNRSQQASIYRRRCGAWRHVAYHPRVRRLAETAAEKQAEADAVRNQLVGLQADLETAGENYYAALDEQESAQRSMEEQQVKHRRDHREDRGSARRSTRARSMYRSGSTTFIDFLLGASSFAEFTQNWELLNQINANDADLVDQTKAAREQLQAAKDEFARQEQIAAQKAAECAASTTRFRSRCRTPPNS